MDRRDARVEAPRARKAFGRSVGKSCGTRIVLCCAMLSGGGALAAETPPAPADGFAIPWTPAADAIELAIPFDGEPCRLLLRRHRLRAPGCRAQLVGERTRTLEAHELPPPATYRGLLLGPEGGQRDVQVAASRGPDGTWTGILLGPARLLSLQPAKGPGLPAGQHVLRDARELGPDALRCGNSSFPSAEDLLSTRGGSGGGGTRGGGAGQHLTEIAIEADFKYYKLLNRDVDAVIQDIEAVMNAVDLIYRRDVDIAYEIPYYLVRTSRDHNYDRLHLVRDMTDYWNNNLPHVARDVAHLFTGHLTGGTIGTANIAVLCQTDRAYGWSQSRWTTNFSARVVLTAHELGHNWSAIHCDARDRCQIMCSFIGGCDAGQGFTDKPIADIAAYRDARSCFELVEHEVELPFDDSFESGLVGPAFRYQRGAQVVPGLGGEPSGDWSLELNAEGPAETQWDELRTGLLDWSGSPEPMFLSFYAQPISVPSGDRLEFEFYDQDLRWKPLYSVVSTGVDPGVFEFHRVDLDPLAWPGLRLRVRPTTIDPAHRWYLDDVQVRAHGVSHTVDPLVPGTSASFHARGASAGDTVFFLYSLAGLGDGPCIGGVCLDLQAPIEVLATRVAGAQGTAQVDLNLPVGLPAMDVSFQLLLRGASSWKLSNAVPTRVQ